VLGEVAGLYRSECEEDTNGRVACLTLAINLAADTAVNSAGLCGSVCGFIRRVYHALDVWGCDHETMEVGWLIGNLIKDPLNDCQQQDLALILEWVYDFVVTLDTGKESTGKMLANIYENLPILLSSLQRKCGLAETELPEVFKSIVINLLVDTTTKQLGDQGLDCLPKALLFLAKELHLLLLFCPQEFAMAVVTKAMAFLGWYKESVVAAAFKVLEAAVDTQVGLTVPSYRRLL
jgi:hypothetical protein